MTTSRILLVAGLCYASTASGIVSEAHGWPFLLVAGALFGAALWLCRGARS